MMMLSEDVDNFCGEELNIPNICTTSYLLTSTMCKVPTEASIQVVQWFESPIYI